MGNFAIRSALVLLCTASIASPQALANPQLAAKYRFSGEHALFGHSAGGMFAVYALFQRPGAFDKMIIGSP